MTEFSYAPWNGDEVWSLNEFQRSGVFHPFTCPNRDAGHMPEGHLAATMAGWVCPSCAYRQDWAHAWMADGSWRRWLAQRNELLGGQA